MPAVKSFFPPLVVGGQPIDLTHLEPFQFVMNTAARPGGAIVDVRFSNHCFSDTYDAKRHPEPVDVWDRGQRRAFDRERYDLSLGLRPVIEALPAASVFYTPESNFVRIVPPGEEAEYRIYFNVKRGGGPVAADVSLFIESAYRPDGRKHVLRPAQMTKVKFALLVDKTVRGERLSFQYRR